MASPAAALCQKQSPGLWLAGCMLAAGSSACSPALQDKACPNIWLDPARCFIVCRKLCNSIYWVTQKRAEHKRCAPEAEARKEARAASSAHCAQAGLLGWVRDAGALQPDWPEIKSLSSEMINGAPNTPQHRV